MTTIHREAIVEEDGELHLSELPCHKGDRVEAIIVIQSESTEESRQQARERLLALARSSTFKSTGPYPSRDELHERS
jgi:hypothetical protein